MSLNDLQTFIKLAEEHCASSNEIEQIKSVTSIEDLLSHPWSSDLAYWYAKDIIKGRWLEGESVILKSPDLAFLYARDVIKDRWLEAESIIRTDPYWAYWYARNMIKDRWIDAEPFIKTDFYTWGQYQNFIKGEANIKPVSNRSTFRYDRDEIIGPFL